MTKCNNVKNKITMMMLAVFMMMLMILVPTKKVAAAGGSNFYNAQQIPFGKENSSTTPMQGSQYYKFRTNSSKATYKIKFINLTGSYDDFHYYLYDEDFNEVDHYIWISTGATREYSNLKKNSTYYVKFASWYSHEIDYVFSARQALQPPAKVAISKVSPGRKKLTLRWASAPRAKAYQVAIRKAGGKWKTYSVSSRKKTFTKLKSRKKYSVRVRGFFRTDSGAKIYGKWSSIRKITVK